MQCAQPKRSCGRLPRGFTLVEVMVAAALTLVLMTGVMSMFAYVTNKVTESRAVLETTDQLRIAKQRLQLDLLGATASTLPSLKPESEQGYFEVIEGPLGPVFYNYGGYAVGNHNFDYSVGDNDDILMFTTRGVNENFVGHWYTPYTNPSGNVMRSPVAEIAWFLRGGTLYRRLLLVRPSAASTYGYSTSTATYNYGNYDLSMRQEGGAYDYHGYPSNLTPALNSGGIYPIVLANSLGDLTKRENRYAHQPLAWPHDARFWGRTAQWSSPGGVAGPPTQAPDNRPGLGLPTLSECATGNWPFPFYGPTASKTPRMGNPGYTAFIQSPLFPNDLRQKLVVPIGTNNISNPVIGGCLALHAGTYNPWGVNTTNANTFVMAGGSINGYGAGRYDDVVMNHVLSFDVKVWDPGAPIFQVQTSTTAGAAGYPNAVLPGDPGYVLALGNFIGNPAPTNTTAALSGLGAYVDLNYMFPNGYYTRYCNMPNPAQNALTRYENNASVKLGLAGTMLTAPWFAGPPDPRSGLGSMSSAATTNTNLFVGPLASVWDTYPTHYENDGVDNNNNGLVDEGTDGVDNAPGVFGVDDPTEQETAPPYQHPLRGIQIKIRAFEPDSKQVREVTIVHEFLQE